MRDAFFASPRLPRLADPNAIKDTIVSGGREGFLAYVGKTAEGRYDPFYFRAQLNPYHVELSDEMFVITGEAAEAYLARQQATATQESGNKDQVIRENAMSGSPDAGTGRTSGFQVVAPVQPEPERPQPPGARGAHARLAWAGEAPAQKWMNFYTKVLSRFAVGGGLKLTVQVEVAPPGGVSEQKVEETKMALRELGLVDQVNTE